MNIRSTSESELYKIFLDGEWSLAEFYEMPHAYSQVYAVVYGLEFPSEFEERGSILRYSNHPWKGGFSAVNFYREVQLSVPWSDRPRIIAIRYSSPGWIELGLAVGVALSIRRIVKNFVDAVSELTALYHDIYKQSHERKMMAMEANRADLKLAKDELSFLETSRRRLAQLLELPGSEMLFAQAPNQRELRMLLSLFRRIRILAEYESKGKARF